MKTPFLLGLAVVSLWLSGLSLAPAQEKVDGFPGSSDSGTEQPVGTRMVRVQVEFIEVSLEQFTDLMFGAKPAANDTELRKQVAQLINDGKASVMENLLCTTRDGQKATTESIEEFIYPTEYEPAELPLVEKTKEGETPKIDSDRVDEATGPTPTAFETRNLGPTLEIEPGISEDGKSIGMRLVSEIVHHIGDNIWAEWKGPHGNSPIQMPTFYTIRCNTNVTVADGRHALVAALSPKDEKGFPDFKRKLMVFVKADIITPGN